MNDKATERVEYRVVGIERRTGHDWEGEPRRERPSVEHLRQLRSRNDNVRVQSSTVTRTPWTDLEEEE